MAKIIYAPESTLLLHNQRMLQVMRYVLSNKIKGIKTEGEFVERIASANKVNLLAAIKRGRQSFVIADIRKCCEIFGVDANFFILEGHLTMMRAKQTKTPFEQLLVAVQAVGLEMGAFTPLTKDEVEESKTEAEKLRRSREIIEAEEKRKKENFEFI